MAARRAYALIAHSSHDNTDFKVPDGVTIIMKRKAGQKTDARGDIMKLLCDRTGLFTNPGGRESQIVDQLGSVAFYETGSKAPNESLTFFVGAKKGAILEFIPFSGVIPIGGPAARAGCREIKGRLLQIDPDSPPDFLVPDMYDLSVYPLRSQIKDVIAELPGSVTIEQLRKAPDTHPFKAVVHVRLQELVNTLGPGIYYMTTCRSMKGNPIYNINETSNWRHDTYRFHLRKNLQSISMSASQFPASVAAARPLLLATIGEAETRRKRAIPGSRFSRLAANWRPPRARTQRARTAAAAPAAAVQ
jgi:hypothetical protein